MSLPNRRARILTIVFSDMESSSKLWEEWGGGFYAVLEAHFEILRQACMNHGGHVVKSTGDGLYMVFDDPEHAILCAIEAQLELSAHPDIPRARIGIETGGVYDAGAGDYVGPPVNRAARICAAAAPGCIYLSEGTKALLGNRTPVDCALKPVGRRELRNIGEHQLFCVAHASLPAPEEVPVPIGGSLPYVGDAFIGRQRWVDRVSEALLDSDTRCLAILGTGGVGKTRLTIECAKRLNEHFPDGLGVAELDGIQDTELALSILTSLLRNFGYEGEPRVQEIGNFLANRRVLLLLDGVEALEAAADIATGILSRTTLTKLLVTSRRRQRLPAKFIELDPLSLDEAMLLFRTRVESLGQTYVPTRRNEMDLRELCERLACVPLALELAAARYELISPKEMVAKLDEGLTWLQDSDTDRTSHRSSLEEAIRWSYELLSDQGKRALKQAALFPIGFRLDTWEQVAGADAILNLAELHHSSLMVTESRLDQPGRRCYLLETIRIFALQRLAEDPALHEATLVRLADIVLDKAWRRLSLCRTAGEPASMKDLNAELPDLDSVLSHARQLGRDDILVRACEISAAYHHYCGINRRAKALAQEGMSRPGGFNREQLMRWLVSACIDLHEYEEAKGLATEMASLPNANRARALNLLALAEAGLQEGDAAVHHYREALELAGDDLELEAMVRHNLGYLAFLEHDRDEAASQWARAIHIREETGDQRGIAETATNLGLLEWERANVSRATSLHEMALAASVALQDFEGMARALFNLGEIDEALGDRGAADRHFAAAHTLFERAESANLRYTAAVLAESPDREAVLNSLRHMSIEAVLNWARPIHEGVHVQTLAGPLGEGPE